MLLHVARQSGPVQSGTVSSAGEIRNFEELIEARWFVVIETRAGLGNRLRALATAAALAKHTGRELLVVWIPDPHTDCLFSQLFETTGMYVSSTDVKPIFLRGGDTVFYDYDTKPGVMIEGTARKHIYVRSGRALNSTDFVWEDVNHFLQHDLRLKDLPDKLATRYSQIQTEIATTSHAVGVHIRMLTNLSNDIPGIETLPNTDTSAIYNMLSSVEHRRGCHVDYFITRMQVMLQENSEYVFFAAVDSPEARIKLKKAFGHKVRFVMGYNLERYCEQDKKRQSFCLKAAMVEFKLLAHTSKLLLSEWSSASELVRMLARSDVETSCGCQQCI